MNKNKIEIIEINDDFESIRLNNSNYKNIEKEEYIDCDSISKNKLSKYLLCFIIVIIMLLIILINSIIKVRYFTPTEIKNEYNRYDQYDPDNPDINYIPYKRSVLPSSSYFVEQYRNEKETDYDKKGKKIYSSTGTLSFNKLDEIYYGIKLNISKFNHIHLAMSFDDVYHLLSTVTIASLLKNAKPTSYIHIHIITVNNFDFRAMKTLNSLKNKINNNTEFIFHNGDKVLKDFGNHIKDEEKGIGEYARLLAPYFANETDRIIVLDSADLFIKKDLLQLYNYKLEDKLVKGALDPYTKCFPDYQFFHKENYFNGGVLLFNARRWREMDIYHDIVTFYKKFKYKGRMPTPIQDILNTFFPAITVGLLPLKYNMQGIVDLKDDDGNYPDNNIIELKCSRFFKKKKKIIKDEKNIVIRHVNKYKPYEGESSYKIIKEWNDYAKLTGFYKEICERYPYGCDSYY